jgi:hypothetical protein
MSELEGRGAAWTDAPKGRRKGVPEVHMKQSTSDEGRRRLKAPRKRAGDTA